MGCVKWLTLVGGIFTIFVGLITIRDSIGLGFLAFGAILIALSIFGSRALKKLYVYTARIGFDLIEEDIAKSTDQEYIQKIINAVNEAVRNRG